MKTENNDFLKDLRTLKYSPTLAQDRVLTNIQNALGGKLNMSDPTSPFIMMTEAATYGYTAAVLESTSLLKNVYPSMAETYDELFRHITGEEEINLYATPSVGIFKFFVNIIDFYNYGIYLEDIKSYLLTIPKYSRIVVDEISFTITNNINMYLKIENDRTISYIEIENDDNEVSIKNIGNVDSVIYTDYDNVNWLVFNLPIKQIERHVFEDTFTLSVSYNKEIEIDDLLYLSEAYVSSEQNDNWLKLKKSLSDIVLIKEDNTVNINFKKPFISIKTPPISNVYNNLDGKFKLVYYTTIGKLYVPLYKYSQDDFMLLINPSELASAVNIDKIAITISSDYVIDGGKDNSDIESLRRKIINNTTGLQNLPITLEQLKELSLENGYSIEEALDTLSKRLFIATKKPNLDIFLDNKSTIDIYNLTTTLEYESIEDTNIKTYDNLMIIPSNTTFKYENGITKPLKLTDEYNLKNNTNRLIENILNTNNYFYNIFYYIIKLDNNIIESRVYDLDNPKIDNLEIIKKSTYTNIKANITGYKIKKENNKYILLFKVDGNDEYENIDNSDLFLEIRFKIADSNEYICFTAEINEEGLFEARIETNYIINESHQLLLNNGYSNLPNKYIELKNKTEVYLYTTKYNVETNKELSILYPKKENYNVLTKHTIDIEIGNFLNYLWNKISIGYTKRKYKTYTRDKPKVYEEDVYETVDGCNTVINLIDDDNDGIDDRINYNIIHNKGEVVKDIDGNIVYEFRKGDLVRDDNGNLIIDKEKSVIYYTDIVMLDYKNKHIDNELHTKTLEELLLNIRYWLNNQLNDLNRKVMNNTTILYRPSKSLTNTKIKVGKNIINISNVIIRPKVTLYVKNYNETNSEYLKINIGKILDDKLLDKNIDLAKIANYLIDTLTVDIESINLENITPENYVIFKYLDSSHRFSIKKIIKDNNVIYDYDLVIIPLD